MRIAALLLPALLAAASVGCALTQRTDRLFIGTVGGAPVHEHRLATGIFLVPFALAADLVTFPIQALVLVVGGDDVLYSRAGPQQGAVLAPTTLYALDRGGNLVPVAVTAERMDRLVARLRERGRLP